MVLPDPYKQLIRVALVYIRLVCACRMHLAWLAVNERNVCHELRTVVYIHVLQSTSAVSYRHNCMYVYSASYEYKILVYTHTQQISLYTIVLQCKNS